MNNENQNKASLPLEYPHTASDDPQMVYNDLGNTDTSLALVILESEHSDHDNIPASSSHEPDVVLSKALIEMDEINKRP